MSRASFELLLQHYLALSMNFDEIMGKPLPGIGKPLYVILSAAKDLRRPAGSCVQTRDPSLRSG